ncbi:SLATT domain-containing protein [Arthrobacter psychrochitiniphilus]|uniref:SLATT domain-containing protein n=1 Tax=Arthrobacter psychrochitiniphilus TaxID=291045 RepID=UPI003F7C4616
MNFPHEDAFRKLSITIYTTYLVRIQAQKRLASRAVAWNLSLIISSVGLLMASISLLVNDAKNMNVTTTMLSAIVVVASVWATSLNYGPRSRDMFWNYRQIQTLSNSIDSEILYISSHPIENKDAYKLLIEYSKEYNSLLNSENHTTSDYAAMSASEQAKVIRAYRRHGSTLNLSRKKTEEISDDTKKVDSKKVSSSIFFAYCNEGLIRLFFRWTLTASPVLLSFTSVYTAFGDSNWN